MAEQSQQHQLRCRCCISHKFLEAATLNSQKIAVIHAALPPIPSHGGSRSPVEAADLHSPPLYDGDRRFTFSQLLNSVHSLSSRILTLLHGENNSKNDDSPKILGIFMPASVEYIVSVLSVLRCGEAFLPLDPSWPRERLLSIISASKVDVIITSELLFDEGSGSNDFGGSNWLMEGSGCLVLCFSMEDTVEFCGGDALKLAWPCEKEEKGRAFCYLMYTSGSTGKPKGVCGTEQGLLNRFHWMQELYPLHAEDVLLFKTSISFIDHLQEFLSPMLGACTLVIPPFNLLKKCPFVVVDLLQAYSISRVVAVPSLMRAILPYLQSQDNIRIQYSLKLLVLSGEVFSISLWDVLSKLLPKTSILNLYGSTEVSGDCTYFDCKRLPVILETEALTSVPIGVPITNCDVLLVGETKTSNLGEIYVGGLCVSSGYYSESNRISSFENVKVHKNIDESSKDDCGSQLYYRTGDFARRLQCGDLVFLGRKDRTIKINGQRISLDEIEITLREHPDINDAAVVLRQGPGEILLLDAFLLLKEREKSEELLRSSIRSWMLGKVPLGMIPNCFVFTESLPMASSGKINYALLASSAFSNINAEDENGNTSTGNLLDVIKKAFCDILMVKDVSSDDDFFLMGGNSVAAAHVSYNLGIDIRLLYNFPTPSKLHVALLDRKESANMGASGSGAKWKLITKAESQNVSYSVNSSILNSDRFKSLELKNRYQKNGDHTVVSKRFKVDSDKFISTKSLNPLNGFPWSASISMSCSFSRGNKVMYEKDYDLRNACQVISLSEDPRSKQVFAMQEFWKVHLESCVDASPLVVIKDQDVYLFIGSHAHKFVCINAKSGSIQWDVKLEGRIECSAAVLGDFSQVVVGCYMGKIYFLDFFSGNICWTYQTFGEVKCQPVVDRRRHLIWCGSHDHNLYGLDYKSHCCIFKLSCGGSIYGSPAIDEVHDSLYVASTSGRVTAISIRALPFYSLWQHELEVPVFGSLAICSSNGNVICCLVDGNIVVIDLDGSIIWRRRTGGPVFAGACISHVLISQVVICSRNGTVYSFEMEKGDLLWEHHVGDPITASAYVDEHMELISYPSLLSDRLVCVCTSSGNMHLLRVKMNIAEKANQPCKNMVQEFARLELPGDIFSSPVMIGGKIFVGCRDDYAYCIIVQTEDFPEE